MNKRLAITLIILAFFVSWVYFYLVNKTVTEHDALPEPPKMPGIHYVKGVVETITGDIYTIQREDVKTKQDFTIPPDVLVYKRSKDKTGLAHPITQLIEVRVGSQVVIYYESEKVINGQPQIKITGIDIIK